MKIIQKHDYCLLALSLFFTSTIFRRVRGRYEKQNNGKEIYSHAFVPVSALMLDRCT